MTLAIVRRMDLWWTNPLLWSEYDCGDVVHRPTEYATLLLMVLITQRGMTDFTALVYGEELRVLHDMPWLWEQERAAEVARRLNLPLETVEWQLVHAEEWLHVAMRWGGA